MFNSMILYYKNHTISIFITKKKMLTLFHDVNIGNAVKT